MNVTPSSTAADDIERERREGSLLWGRTRALLNELDALRAGAEPQADLAAARQVLDRERVVQMAAAHTDKAQQRRQSLEDAVMMVLQAQDGYRPLAAMTGAQRVDVVVKRLGDAPVKYGLPEGWKSSDRKERIVRKIVNTWFKSRF